MSLYMEWYDICIKVCSLSNMVLRKPCYVISYIVICCACHTNSGRGEDRSSLTLDHCGSAHHIGYRDYGLHCTLNLYCHAISLCAAKANLCYACLAWFAVPLCDLPQPGRSSATAWLVYTGCTAKRPPDVAANHYHGTWYSG